MRSAALMMLVFLLAPYSPASGAPPKPSERVVFLEGCNASLTVEPPMVPVEVQADSFLGRDSSDHSFLALVCRPNAGRTFEPGSGEVSQRRMRVHGDDRGGSGLFWSEVFEKADAPLSGIHSWNLRWATRSHVFLLVVYPDPSALKKGQQDDPTRRRAQLEHASTLLLLGDGSEPAILESAYRHRLMALGAAILIVFTGSALLLFTRIRHKWRRTNDVRSSSTRDTHPPD